MEALIRPFQPPKPSESSAEEQFSSAYYKDLTQEDYMVGRVFQGNNFHFLRELPDKIQHKGLLQRRKDRVKAQVEAEAAQRGRPYDDKQRELADKAKTKKLQKVGTLGFFELFPYEPSPYDLAQQLLTLDRLDSEGQRRKIAEVEFRPNDHERKGKYEDPFTFKDRLDLTPNDNSKYLFPFHLPE